MLELKARIKDGWLGPAFEGVLSNGLRVQVMPLNCHSAALQEDLRSRQKLLAALRLPRIAVSEGILPFNGVPCWVGAWPEGPSLGHLLSSHGSFPSQAVASIGCDVFTVLADLSARRIIHGDLHPAALYLSQTGEVWMDGLGRRPVGDVPPRTSSRRYIPPEGFASSASDVFALGVILAELLLGRKVDLFSMGSQGHQQQLNQVIIDIGTPSDAPSIVSAIAAALSYDANHRPEASQLAQQFSTIRTQPQVLARWVKHLMSKTPGQELLDPMHSYFHGGPGGLDRFPVEMDAEATLPSDMLVAEDGLSLGGSPLDLLYTDEFATDMVTELDDGSYAQEDGYHALEVAEEDGSEVAGEDGYDDGDGDGYDEDGYDEDGYDEDGYDEDGYDDGDGHDDGDGSGDGDGYDDAVAHVGEVYDDEGIFTDEEELYEEEGIAPFQPGDAEHDYADVTEPLPPPDDGNGGMHGGGHRYQPIRTRPGQTLGFDLFEDFDAEDEEEGAPLSSSPDNTDTIYVDDEPVQGYAGDDHGQAALEEDRGQVTLEEDRGQVTLEEDRGQVTLEEDRGQVTLEEDPVPEYFHSSIVPEMEVTEDLDLPPDPTAVESEDYGSYDASASHTIVGEVALSDDGGSFFHVPEEDNEAPFASISMQYTETAEVESTAGWRKPVLMGTGAIAALLLLLLAWDSASDREPPPQGAPVGTEAAPVPAELPPPADTGEEVEVPSEQPVVADGGAEGEIPVVEEASAPVISRARSERRPRAPRTRSSGSTLSPTLQDDDGGDGDVEVAEPPAAEEDEFLASEEDNPWLQEEEGAPSKPEPVPEFSADTATGLIKVVGAVDRIELLKEGESFSPGRLPVGSYKVKVYYLEMEPAIIGSIDLQADQSAVINCDEMFMLCKL